MDPWGTPHLMVCSEEQVWLIWTHCWGQEKVRVRWSNSLTFSKEQLGRFPFDQNSWNSGFGSKWNRHFPEFHSEILGVPRKVGLRFRKIGITGKFRSIRPFLLAPSFSEPGNRTQHGFQFFCSISVFRLLLCDRWLECSFAPLLHRSHGKLS